MKDLFYMDHPVSFPSYEPQTAWLLHGAFAMWLARAARPETLVELGSHLGFSYFAFCQAIKSAQIGTRCYAVDTWEGDDHAGRYGEDVFEAVQKENKKYAKFSTLMRMTFAQAVNDFADNTIDLLHIDGRHGYKDVKHDFETWRPKLSKSAIVLFHDTEVVRDDFGVKQFWGEVSRGHDSFNFSFQNGLGVLFMDEDRTPEIASLRRSLRDPHFGTVFSDLFMSQARLHISRRKEARLETSRSEQIDRIHAERRKILEKDTEVALMRRSIDAAGPALIQLADENQQLRKSLAHARARAHRLWADYLKFKAAKILLTSPLGRFETIRSRLSHSMEKREPKRSLATTQSDLESGILQHGAYALALEKRDPVTPVTLAGQALIDKTRTAGYAAAAAEVAAFKEALAKVEDPATALKALHPLIVSGNPSTQGPVATPASSTTPAPSKDALHPGEIVIYTSLFGNYDKLPPVCTPAEGIDFVCFTDQDISARGWTIVHDAPRFLDPNLSAKYYKINPHDVFPGKSKSLFVDANTLMLGRLDLLVTKWLAHHDFAMWRHPERSDIVSEAEAIILYNREDPEKIRAQMAEYEANGVTRHEGLYECSFIWRRHHAPEIRDLMTRWWDDIMRLSKRDQLSFYALAHGVGPKPHVLPNFLGTSRHNYYFTKLQHQPMRVKTRTKPRGSKKVAFLYDETTSQSGSTIMRSRQLPEILSRKLGDEIEIVSTPDMEQARDSLVVVGKRMIGRLSAEDLAALKSCNIAVAADPVDESVEIDKLKAFDLIICASLKAMFDGNYAQELDQMYLVTHHADPRIPRIDAPGEKVKIGYFGEFVNTVGLGSLDHLIDFHSVSTSNADDRWLDVLGAYNAHFAVRNQRDIDGFKPFTKGFVAAKCGAVVLCEKHVGDNRYYLGEDYPFYVPRTDPKELEGFLFDLKDQYGSREWLYAMQIMQQVAHRSSEAWIADEFRAIVKDVWA